MSGDGRSGWGAAAAVIGAVAALITALVGAYALLGPKKSEAGAASTSVTTTTTTTTTKSGGGGGGGNSGGGRITTTTKTTKKDTKPPAFAVTEVQLNVEPSGGTVACDTESKVFTFRGAIVANGAGEVRYRWIRSDGAIGPNDSGTLRFDAAGTKRLDEITWQFGVPAEERVRDGSYTLEVDMPNTISKKATARLACA
ncbi:hypothetical protein SAMN05192558_106241 [Actinokineospora alba]|uniref:Uncharacterized protein n=1 Tax=Actinokineospora alba TaxID=504798 RepID=A0A1H0PT36_9PSEU|nr:hypothetical protein [Actinokineospora alba]TDP65916.1 hypothetical protein C8E96_1408 [Actinokineospora alba]SDI62283.1 hypothetical protein SAMN05421871_106211 [Actinokineospora alba]SDP07706.1 hypothetical protein SAMN05192558_106241 [Actinokineospora alba]